MPVLVMPAAETDGFVIEEEGALAGTEHALGIIDRRCSIRAVGHAAHECFRAFIVHAVGIER